MTRLSATVFALALLCAGCVDQIQYAEPAIEQEVSASKFRHPRMMARAVSKTAGKDEDLEGLNLIVGYSDGSVDAYRVLDRYKVLDRYRVVRRYEYDDVMSGSAWTIVDTTGNADYGSFFDAVASDPDIAWFEPDFRMIAPALQGMEASFTEEIPESVVQIGATETVDASGVSIYVVDSGVSHTDLNVVEAIDFRAGSASVWDEDGHGTHIAGIAAAIYNSSGLQGIAPGAQVHNLKVFGADGGADVSIVLAALEHVMEDHNSDPARPKVVNLSLGEDVGSEAETALDQAVNALHAAGITVVVAAGNAGMDAATISPAHARGALTVGSHNGRRQFSRFSNRGPHIDVIAPGEAIISLSVPNVLTQTLYQTVNMSFFVEMSGTSMSAAHVTGATARYLALYPQASAAEVRNAIVDQSIVMRRPPSGTTGAALYVGDF